MSQQRKGGIEVRGKEGKHFTQKSRENTSRRWEMVWKVREKIYHTNYVR
jgi:hypothetical protein